MPTCWRRFLHLAQKKLDEVEAPAPFPAVEQVPALPEPLGATVRAARELFTETSLTAGFEWAMSDRAHSWDAEHRRQLEYARAIGGAYSAHGIHGAHRRRRNASCHR